MRLSHMKASMLVSRIGHPVSFYSMHDPVVITGAGMVSSLGLTAPATWEALLAGKSGIGPIRAFDAAGFDCAVAAQVREISASELGIHPRDARIMDTHSLMMMKCSHDACGEARLDKASLAGEDIGLFAGMGMVDYHVDDLLPAVRKSSDSKGHVDYDKFFSGGYQEIYPLWPLSLLNNISFCQVAISLDIRGENAVFSPYADSGAQAISEGAEALLAGKARAVLAGGVSMKVSPQSLARAHMSGVLYRGEEGEDATCRPFSVSRRGTVPGEGCGMVVMELLSSALSRGATAGAKISGFGFSFGLAEGACGPAMDAICRSMETALEKAGISPGEMDVIIANGDGTLSGDQNEKEAIQEVFSSSMERISIYSSKGSLGNMYAASPAGDVILGSYILRNGRVPPTANADSGKSARGFNVVVGKPLEKKAERVMVNCQSPGGQSASLIVEAVDI
jgi:3-oxoacyl-[acyl-carrier-protein] synthase II